MIEAQILFGRRVILGATSGPQTRPIFFALSMTAKERFSSDISLHALEYVFAALIQGFASTFRHQFFEDLPHLFYSIHQIIQLCKLS